jgi:hypothetical protein
MGIPLLELPPDLAFIHRQQTLRDDSSLPGRSWDMLAATTRMDKSPDYAQSESTEGRSPQLDRHPPYPQRLGCARLFSGRPELRISITHCL